MIRRVLAFAALAAALSACATVQKLPAASDVHALLIAIRDGDQPAFDALVDRKALNAEIATRLAQEAGKQKDERVSALAALLAPTLAKSLGDNFIRPQVFRAVAEHYGYTPDKKIPDVLTITAALRQLPDGRICAVSKKDGPCLLDFTKAEDGRWKLSGFEGDTAMLKIRR